MENGSVERDALSSLAASALRVIARTPELKEYVRSNQPLYEVLLRAALRYIGGETLESCLGTIRYANGIGNAVSADYMGEDTRGGKEVSRVTEEFVRLCGAIGDESLRASVSLDLSHVGLLIDTELCFENAKHVAEAARSAGIELLLNMESSERTTGILRMHERLCAEFDHVGVTVQAYLKRTSEDIPALMERPGRIRLVKGAYLEPEEICLSRSSGTVDAAYRACLEMLIARAHPCSIATHDPRMLDCATALLGGSPLPSVEFEMLHGVRPDRLAGLRDRGFPVREYVPYGQEWHLYVCHRLAECPENVYLALADCTGVSTNANSHG